MCVIRNHPYPCAGTWPWDTADQVEAALAAMPSAESRSAVSLTGGVPAPGPRERPVVPVEKEYRLDTAGGR